LSYLLLNFFPETRKPRAEIYLIVGGILKGFVTIIKAAEFLKKTFPDIFWGGTWPYHPALFHRLL
jgi:hypothetical protein